MCYLNVFLACLMFMMILKNSVSDDDISVLDETERCSEQNEVYRDSDSPCESTCHNRGSIGSCSRDNEPGCFCKLGFWRNEDNKCIRPKDCPRHPECVGGKVYNYCGTACEETCFNNFLNKFRVQSPRVCILRCVEGCFCKHGFINYFDKCILPEECPNYDLTPEAVVYLKKKIKEDDKWQREVEKRILSSSI